ncbi:hypothetical protein ACOSQ2_009976 [Xanthoceras sorbifolium]
MLSHESRLSKRNIVEQLNFAQANISSYHGNKKYQKPFQPSLHKSFQPNSPQSRPMSPQFLNKNSNQFSQFNNTMPSILGKPQNQMSGPKWQPKPNHQVGNTKCQICGKFGHIAPVCYHRTNLNYQPQNNSPQANFR